jgi:enoyl-CoA hydratase
VCMSTPSRKQRQNLLPRQGTTVIPVRTIPDQSKEMIMSEPNLKSEGQIKSELDGSVYWITFDNPSRMNALNTSMWASLPKIISEAEEDQSVRAVVLCGSGDKAFSAGADISQFGTARTGDASKAYDKLNHAAFGAVMNCAKPTIAMIQGYCMGGGLELALCCDLRYAAQGSTFAIPAAKLGIGYNPRWIRPLLSALSATQAKEILFTGRRFSDEEALHMGMITRLCPSDMLEEETRALAGMIAENAPLSITAAKHCIDEFLRSPENPDMDALDKLVEACFESEDYGEGRTAFTEKRKPVFRGK